MMSFVQLTWCPSDTRPWVAHACGFECFTVKAFHGEGATWLRPVLNGTDEKETNPN